MQRSKLQNLAPAPSKPGTPGLETSSSDSSTPRRTSRASTRKGSTNHACVQCRKNKTKCDGSHPCGRCRFSSSSCTYDTQTLSGERLNRLTHAFNHQKNRLHQLETILAAMRGGTDEEAAETMAWIRIGESVESIVTYLESRTNHETSVISPRFFSAESRAHSKFIETLFDKEEWLGEATPEAQPVRIELGARTRSHLSSRFGNLPFSSGIKANHYPPPAQQGQLQNYYARHKWAMMTANDGYGVKSVTTVWADTVQEGRRLIAEGVPPEELIGTFPAVGALLDEKEYESAPMVSKWAVRFIYSCTHRDYFFTSLAAVWVVWNMMRWMINPTPETYAALPEWLRPTQLQVFVPHIDMLDCVVWPYFRDYYIQHPEMQHGDLRWVEASASGIRTRWEKSIEEALYVDEATGKQRLTAEAEARIRDLNNWSLAASYRAFMPGIDGKIPIRTVEDPVKDSSPD
ncbi:hypothetical protein FZEAL_6225 [Fusarium zealandicum]|uniref:Zn(2)-C6 fungal-type domain-containing protein n=1 Tax=Fusarium zealandicum TaxID=1053134 RepID=A0A8H4XJ09_9HYPO|nr:hypothetical protein FZEAL_6225 [Fusarium zealandicum]